MATVNFKNFCSEMEILEISKLKFIWSPEFTIHGFPWKLTVRKMGEDENQSLAVILCCTIADKSPHWSLWGTMSLKLLPFSNEANPIEYYSDPYVFSATASVHGTLDPIKWNDLFNQNKKYVKDDKINLKFEVMAENLNDPNRSTLKFECVQTSCDNCNFAKFRLTVTDIENLMAVKSPTFTLRGLLWDMQVLKTRSSHLGILLQLKTNTAKAPIKMAMSVKIISSKEGVQPIEAFTECEYLKRIVTIVLSWNEMLKPENGFVNNDSITLEIAFGLNKSNANDSPTAKRLKRHPENGNKFLKLECPICLKCIGGQDLASTKCGHLFCFACIKEVVNDRGACPICNKAVQLKSLRQLYLPVVD